MQTYKVYEAEARTTPTGKQLKKLVLQREGAQHPTKGVTIWGDNPLYSQANPGGTLTCDLLETDSGKPNPNAPGKNYINRTVANPNQPLSTTAPHTAPNLAEMAIKTHISQEIASLRYDLKLIAEHLGMTNLKEKSVIPDYPEELEPDEIPF